MKLNLVKHMGYNYGSSFDVAAISSAITNIMFFMRKPLRCCKWYANSLLSAFLYQSIIPINSKIMCFLFLTIGLHHKYNTHRVNSLDVHFHKTPYYEKSTLVQWNQVWNLLRHEYKIL